MPKPTPISEMRKFRLGTKILCSDGEEGSLASIGFDRAHQCLIAVGIHIGRLFGKTVYVPFSHVVDAPSRSISLAITCAQLSEASQKTSIGIWLNSRASVFNANASTRGMVTLVAIHPDSGELSYVVAHHLRPAHDTLLPENVVTKIDANQITISLPDATLQTLPPYRTDEELRAEVERILFDLAPLHVDLRGITLRVIDGVLYLNGNISSSLRGDIVEDQALGIQGLLEIKNRLVGDDLLACDLALALGRDPHTRDLPIGVYPRLGVVRLSGAVHNEQQKTTAEEITKGFPGVRGVINDLVIKPNSDLLPVMSPAAGGESQDLIPGKYVRHTK